MSWRAWVVAVPIGLHPTRQEADDEDHRQEAQDPARVITPLPAVGPGGEDGEHRHEQEDKQEDDHAGPPYSEW